MITGKYVRGPQGRILPPPDEPYLYIIVEHHATDTKACLCTWHYAICQPVRLRLLVVEVEGFVEKQIWKFSDPWLELPEGL